jgi:hypothetical protein
VREYDSIYPSTRCFGDENECTLADRVSANFGRITPNKLVRTRRLRFLVQIIRFPFINREIAYEDLKFEPRFLDNLSMAVESDVHTADKSIRFRIESHHVTNIVDPFYITKNLDSKISTILFKKIKKTTCRLPPYPCRPTPQIFPSRRSRAWIFQAAASGSLDCLQQGTLKRSELYI